jgi:hypothetical protein
VLRADLQHGKNTNKEFIGLLVFLPLVWHWCNTHDGESGITISLEFLLSHMHLLNPNEGVKITLLCN